jgi:hypothetical protein
VAVMHVRQGYRSGVILRRGAGSQHGPTGSFKDDCKS